MHAELELVVCSGPVRGKQQTYALVDERVAPESSPPPAREAAVAELVLRYFKGHGPATLRDFTWWSSLTAAEARTGLAAAADALASWVDGEGRTWIGPPEADRASAAPALLLSTFDETVVAYRDLRVVLAGGDDPSAALLPRPVTIDGRTVGTWRRTLRRAGVAVDVELTAPLGPDQARALDAEVERFGRFLGRPARLAVVTTGR
jgi:hypothetical protein